MTLDDAKSSGVFLDFLVELVLSSSKPLYFWTGFDQRFTRNFINTIDESDVICTKHGSLNAFKYFNLLKLLTEQVFLELETGYFLLLFAIVQVLVYSCDVCNFISIKVKPNLIPKVFDQLFLA